MRDYNAPRLTRQPSQQRQTVHRKQQSHHFHTPKLRQNALNTTPFLSAMSGVIQQVITWMLVVIAVLGLGMLVLWLLRANIHQLYPMKQATTVVLLDPAAGNTSDLLVVQLAANSNKVLIYRVKYQSETQLFSGYGTYPLASIFPLLKIERKSDHYIRATISAALGVMVDRVIPIANMPTFPAEKLEKQPQVVLGSLLRPYWLKPIPGVGVLEKFQWLSYLEQIDLTWVVDQKSDVFTSGFRFEPKYQQLKNCSVAVVNTTMVKGLARRISNVLDGSGLTVIRTAAEQQTGVESMLFFDPEYPDCQPLLSYVQQALPSHKVPQADKALANRFRANIVVILGQDLTESK